MSIEKVIIVLSGWVMLIIGFPYSKIRLVEAPSRFARVFDVCALIFDSRDPMGYRISAGGGVRSAKNPRGNISCLRNFRLNRIRISPDTKKGRVAVWYSMGINV